jgi:hypothetical protein
MQADYNAYLAALSGITGVWPLTETSGTVGAASVGTIGNVTWADNGTTILTCAGGATGPDGVAKAALNTAVAGRGGDLPTFVIPSVNTVGYWINMTSQTGADGLAFEWAVAGFASYVQHDTGATTDIGDGVNLSAGYISIYGTTNATSHHTRASLPNSTWKFVVVVTDPSLAAGSQVKAYIDGALVGSGAGTMSPTTNATSAIAGVLCRAQGGKGLPLTAAMNGLFLMNRAMTTTEMSAAFGKMTAASAATGFRLPTVPNPFTAAATRR